MLDYQTKCSLLSELWQNYRDHETFKDFIEYNDIGLPLAFLLAENLVSEITQEGQLYVNETFNLFIAGLEMKEEEVPFGISLDSLLEMAEAKQS
jgi:hypothetical protein